eukprot:1991770-Prymnesium_polylepis.2
MLEWLFWHASVSALQPERGICRCGSAPSSSNVRAAASFPPSAATISAVPPADVAASRSALRSTSSRTASAEPTCAAIISAEAPEVDLASSAAPPASRALTAWSEARAHPSISGVCPPPSTASALAGGSAWSGTGVQQQLDRGMVPILSGPERGRKAVLVDARRSVAEQK